MCKKVRKTSVWKWGLYTGVKNSVGFTIKINIIYSLKIIILRANKYAFKSWFIIKTFISNKLINIFKILKHQHYENLIFPWLYFRTII